MSESITINGRSFPVVSSTPAKPTTAKQRRAMRRHPLSGDPVEKGTLTLSMAPLSVNALFFCGHEWRAPAGPEHGQCPICSHLYVKWLNYDEIVKAGRR